MYIYIYSIQRKLQNIQEYHIFQGEDTGEGLEAILGCISSYTSLTQAVFMSPLILTLLILYDQETKMPQNYSIRFSDLYYYLIFSCVIIIPQLIVNIFLLHTLEIVHGFKLYDYFTYCHYKFKNRNRKWMGKTNNMDRSIVNAWRSLDLLCFSSQFYYTASIVTWGMLFLVFGLTAMIRNKYTGFGDIAFVFYIAVFIAAYIGLILVLSLVFIHTHTYIYIYIYIYIDSLLPPYMGSAIIRGRSGCGSDMCFRSLQQRAEPEKEYDD